MIDRDSSGRGSSVWKEKRVNEGMIKDSMGMLPRKLFHGHCDVKQVFFGQVPSPQVHVDPGQEDGVGVEIGDLSQGVQNHIETGQSRQIDFLLSRPFQGNLSQ